MKRTIRISAWGFAALLFLTLAAMNVSEAGIPRILEVDNPTSHWIDIHCNGELLGSLAPGERRELHLQSELLSPGRNAVFHLEAFQFDLEGRRLMDETDLFLNRNCELAWVLKE